jgi:hypothetical protein
MNRADPPIAARSHQQTLATPARLKATVPAITRKKQEAVCTTLTHA